MRKGITNQKMMIDITCQAIAEVMRENKNGEVIGSTSHP